MRATSLFTLLTLALAGCRPDYSERDAFLAPTADTGAQLPAEGIWPKGRKVLVAGYSGVPKRDLAAGFSVAGPHYGGNNESQIAQCRQAGIPVIAQIGPFPGNTSGSWEAAAKISLDEVRRRVAEAVRRHAETKEIIMWAIQPEELRPWRKDEMAYLAAVAETVRKEDPLGRPLFLYNPNHRDAASLAAIVPHLDVIGKGCYANIAGHKDNRAWIRWSMEQMVLAAAKARPGAWAVVMPELAKDPEPGDRHLIRAWVRHDTYLGMMSGAKGVFLWSLFPRREVKATWKTWYDAYAECGRELNGERQLGPFFLFGQPRDDLRVSTLEPRRPYPLGSSVRNALEASTTQPGEGKGGMLHPWTKAELALGPERILFLANSCPEPTTFQVSGLPARGLEAANAFDGKPVALGADGQLPDLRLGPWEVVALRFRATTGR
jgi:hypothetical protein